MKPVLQQLNQWNVGLFSQEFRQKKLYPSALDDPSHDVPLTEGTFHGTQLAAMEMFTRIENRFRSYFDVANFESIVPKDNDLAQQQQLFTFQTQGSGNNQLPPHLNMIPAEDRVSILKIFNVGRLATVGSLLGNVIPQNILNFVFGEPGGDTINQIEIRDRARRGQRCGVYAEPNVGDRDDWYSDAMFAQQQLTGGNPTTIAVASDTWIDGFAEEAVRQENITMADFIKEKKTSKRLYIQDNGFFREAIGQPLDATLSCSDSNGQKLFGCAAVSLFHLHDDGNLHPLAIIIDFKKSIDNSVVIFNNRLSAEAATNWPWRYAKLCTKVIFSNGLTPEATDWPWRYAKMCAQVSDWTRHELAIHLVNAHFVEEVVIVAVQRTIPNDHIVYRLLEPHWSKTLSLNAAARSALVPEVIAKIVGYSESQVYAYINDAYYKRFHWQNLYVPNDLKARGFPIGELDQPRFRNYAYGKNVSLMWDAIRTFVSSVIEIHYTDDKAVAEDKYIQDWSKEMHNKDGGNMPSFPNIQHREELIDAIVMCIHIAAPQHTAVNYLQQYYQSFVINKPPCLCAPLPTTIEALKAYQEADLIRALPVNQPRVWLLSEYLPYLLNSRVAEDQNLINYATSLAILSQQTADAAQQRRDAAQQRGDATQQTAEEDQRRNEAAIAKAATTFLNELRRLDTVFKQNSDALGPIQIPYLVMNPSNTANSIII
ncbi:unnamed protein product [Umbelopsis sp. WA50703]